MKTFNRVLAGMVVSFMLVGLNLSGPIAVYAASTPSLGAAATYGVLSSTYTNTSVTTIEGDVGFTTPPAVDPLGTHLNYGSGSPYSIAGTDQGTALSDLASEDCTFVFADGDIDLSIDTTHASSTGVYTPGVYCITGAASVGTAGISLVGDGTYIFRVAGAFNTVPNSVVRVDGASACDVFWTPTEATTLGADTTFRGTVIDDAGITVGANTNWTGRALAFGETVTTDTATITNTCGPAPLTLHVIKTVVNDNGGTATSSDFQVHVKFFGNDVTGSPAAGTSAPGTSYSLFPGTYVVSEDTNDSYVQSFSGACDSSGSITLSSNSRNPTCTITNTDIPPPPPPPPPPTSGGGGRSSRNHNVPVLLAEAGTSTLITTAFVPVPGQVLGAAIAPGFPNTGLPPKEKSIPWNSITLAGVFAVLIYFYFARRKQTA